MKGELDEQGGEQGVLSEVIENGNLLYIIRENT